MSYTTHMLDLGDSLDLEIPLVWRDEPFAPAGLWSLIMTAKRKMTDGDAAAVFQKTSDAGIMVTGSTAVLDIVPVDTRNKLPGVLLCDIQARRISDSKVRTVARFRLHLSSDVTRETTASIPIYTSQPPTVGAIIGNRVTGFYERLFIAELVPGDGQPIVQSEFYSAFPPPVQPLVLNRLTGFYELLFISDSDGDAATVIRTEYYSITAPAQPALIYNQVTGLLELLVIDQTAGDGIPVLKSEPL